MKTVTKTSIGGPLLRPYCVLTAIALGLFALSPAMQAVTPPPDGGYPGQNTAEGQSALLHLAGGTYNTALGWASLGFNVTGNFNTAVGAGTLVANTGDENTATGAGALLSNTTANGNTADGALALFSNTTGFANTAIGDRALFSNNATGNGNGNGNTAIGNLALSSNTTGGANTAVGHQALQSNTFGDGNTAIGGGALFSNTIGSGNTALGDGAGGNVSTANNVICIGANVAGNNVDDSCYIGNIFGSTSSNGVAVFVNSNGRLGTMTSSARFKDEISRWTTPAKHFSRSRRLPSVTRRTLTRKAFQQFGLVAEDVEKVNPDLIVRDKGESPTGSVRAGERDVAQRVPERAS